MLIWISCPACGQRHGVYLSSLLLKGEKLKMPCPITHEQLYVKIAIKVEHETSFDKHDLEIAEEQAQFEEHQWRMEEGINERKRNQLL